MTLKLTSPLSHRMVLKLEDNTYIILEEVNDWVLYRLDDGYLTYVNNCPQQHPDNLFENFGRVDLLEFKREGNPVFKDTDCLKKFGITIEKDEDEDFVITLHDSVTTLTKREFQILVKEMGEMLE